MSEIHRQTPSIDYIEEQTFHPQGERTLNSAGTLDRVEGPFHRDSIIHLAKAANKQVERAAELEAKMSDPLTGLLTREVFLEKLEADIASGKPVGVLFLDLKNFKAVNDIKGHDYGDTVLANFADFLRTQVRSTEDELGRSVDGLGCALGRIGGDEFYIETDLRSREDGSPNVETLTIVKERIAEAMPQFVHEQRESKFLDAIDFNASIVTVLPKQGDMAEQVIAEASKRMHELKEAEPGVRYRTIDIPAET